MYPLKFVNIYKEKPWGNELLKKFRGNIPDQVIGESWDVSCQGDDISIIANGEFEGMSLRELIRLEGASLVGTQLVDVEFPLLMKILTVSDKLSVQVHPDDNYAQSVGEPYGKEELWYIMYAKEGSEIILGTKDCTRGEFEKSIKEDTSEQLMQRIPLVAGDVFHIKPGLMHTVDGEVVLAEIQQNSDITYRVYDYNRGRELHIDQALDCIDFNLKGEKSRGISINYETYTKTYYTVNYHFSVEVYSTKLGFTETSDCERFAIFTCVEGSGNIAYDGGTESISLGDSILIPATLGNYKFIGKLKLIKSYVPDLEAVRKEIIKVIS
ncbi:mannose-6-phosphate isomerase [Alkalibaculum sp. M08DMB]|uniref:Phosphohexomutase n=1 Tax=Alkalibaculum sporogenes TaxID=2655001 RepID=A0A6A7K8G6_9FIRM|nr:type I phosphomannose isomerase catalytic subunit [Alkalibaculum sporogenes]MPW25665.1 mannose-6-phosphate isomerase [Alkalibaculum sporogenes]